MRVREFYLHRTMLSCVLEEAGRARKKSVLLQTIAREREFLKQNQMQQEVFLSKFTQLCAHDPDIPRWMTFESHPNIILDVQTGMLWPNLDKQDWHTFESLDELDCWRLPFKNELELLLEDKSFPLISGEHRTISSLDRLPISSSRALRIDDEYPTLSTREGAPPFCVSSTLLGDVEWPIQGWMSLIRFLTSRNLIPKKGSFARALYLVFGEGAELIRAQRESEDRLIIGKEEFEQLEKELESEQSLEAVQKKQGTVFSEEMLESLKRFLLEKDWRSARLPKLDESILFDQNGGLWELALSTPPTDEYVPVQIDADWEAEEIGTKVRDEALVAIDFGTSNTVVAISENEHVELLRLGLEDWFEDTDDSHYQNPTLLEFIDSKILDVWKKVPHRPPLRWDDLCVSHTVKAKLQGSGIDAEVSRRILSRIKLWVRSQQGGRIYDKDGNEIVFCLPGERPFDPTKPLSLGEEYPIDPIELYAFYLGMSINTRQRGLHLHYYLSFPVQYTLGQRNAILSSFRRGLYRSLPASIVQSDYASRFHVSSIGTEPAAFAASILEEIDEPPPKEGKAFAVFDFGGGTTDFAFGIWRKSQPEKLDEWGNYAVIEHFSPSGSVGLGGEIILWQLAYRIYEQNISLMRSNQIPFTPPSGDRIVEGMEILLRQGHLAQSNVMIMMEKFRPIWERKGEEITNNEGISITLRDHRGVSHTLELFIQLEDLERWLVSRIYEGVQNFALGLKNAFSGRNLPKNIDIFLAGNASRSEIVQVLFGLPVEGTESEFPSKYVKNDDFRTFTELLNQIWLERCPSTHVFPVRTEKGSTLNCKTGVALGMLSLSPGRGLLEKAPGGDSNQAPFSLFVGFKWGPVFHCVLKQNQGYLIWKNMGGLSLSGVFLLYYSSSPLSMMGDTSTLKMRRLRFEVNNEKLFIFVRAIAPYTIEVCVSDKMKIDVDDGIQHQVCTFLP